MALFECHIKSQIMFANASFNVVLPDNIVEDMPWILLLHGLTGDETEWGRFSAVERYAKALGFGVVMPNGQDSFYTDEVYGRAYYSYITKELIPYVQKVFPFSKKREKTFMAGFSMGGYGSLKIGLRNPDVFGAIAALSSAADIYERFKEKKDSFIPNITQYAERCWGLNYLEVLKPHKGNKENLFSLLEDFNYEKDKAPWIYMACGTGDSLFESNVRYHEALEKYPIHHEWHFKEGIHNWEIWDFYIQDALRFFVEYMNTKDK